MNAKTLALELSETARTHANAFRWTLRPAVIALLVVMLIGPKMVAMAYVHAHLWGGASSQNEFLLFGQDLVLWWCLLGVTLYAMQRGSERVLIIVWLLIGFVSGALLIDVRVRELWLKPLDLTIVGYFLSEAPALSSSSELFFGGDCGLGVSFRRLLVFAAVVHASLGAAMWLSRRTVPGPVMPKRIVAIWLAVAALGVLLGAWIPRATYALHENVFISSVSRLIGPTPARKSATQFEQPLRPMSAVLSSPRLRLAGVAPFTNVVIVVLESFRFKDGDPDRAKLAPNMERLARRGLRAKAYVPVPHSSKALYAIVSGRYPTRGVELHEAKPLTQPSFVRALRDQRGADTYAFSAPYLAFENTDGLLRSLGFDVRMGPEELARDSQRDRGTSSYGVDDRCLTDVPARVMGQGGRPFVSILLTINSHHPYLYPGKTEADQADLESYRRSLAYADRVLGEIVDSFEQRGLIEDTLFVIVGDHGESFGEHGSYVHNNSLYEEEITVPLVFWSADGRMEHSETLQARQIDVAPTIADLVGLSDAPVPMQGVSLLRSQARPPAFVASFFDDVSYALVLESTKYLFWPSSGTLLRFDLSADPEERHGLGVTGREREKTLTRITAFADSAAVP